MAINNHQNVQSKQYFLETFTLRRPCMFAQYDGFLGSTEDNADECLLITQEECVLKVSESMRFAGFRLVEHF